MFKNEVFSSRNNNRKEQTYYGGIPHLYTKVGDEKLTYIGKTQKCGTSRNKRGSDAERAIPREERVKSPSSP